MNTMGEWTRMTARSQMSTPNYNHNYFGKLEALQPSQPVPATNRFLILARLPDPMVKNKATSFESKRTIDVLNHYHSYKRKQHQKKKSMRDNTNNHHGSTSLQQPTDCQIP
jgi:hypothetical protein